MTDEMLINRFLHGDVAAFNTLVWRWQKPIFNFIQRYIGNPELARDLTQNTFIRSFNSLAKLRDHSKFSTWLFQIAVNICRDEVRKTKCHTVSINGVNQADETAETLPHLIAPDESDPMVNLNKNELTTILSRALQAISEEQRVVIIMKAYHGLKFSEIAGILKLPLNTVKSRMYYGISALGKVFKDWKINQEDLLYEL